MQRPAIPLKQASSLCNPFMLHGVCACKAHRWVKGTPPNVVVGISDCSDAAVLQCCTVVNCVSSVVVAVLLRALSNVSGAYSVTRGDVTLRGSCLVRRRCANAGVGFDWRTSHLSTIVLGFGGSKRWGIAAAGMLLGKGNGGFMWEFCAELPFRWPPTAASADGSFRRGCC